MRKRYLIVYMVFLLVISSICPLSFGEDSNITEKNKLIEDLKFYCTTPNGFNEIKFENYKKQLLKQDSDEDTKEYLISNSEESITIQNPPLISDLSISPMDSAWPMKCHDLHHTSQSQYSTANNSCIEKWRLYFTGWLDDSPSIGNDGTIYCKGVYNELPYYIYAIYPNGTEKWKYKTEGLIFGSSPAISEDGTIYFGSWDDYLYALNQNGTLKWRFLTYGDIYSSPAIAYDGTIYVGIMGPDTLGRVIAINPNGTEKWHYDTGYWITSDPAISDNGVVYIGSQDDYLYAFWPNGTLYWRFKTGDYIMGPPSIANDGTIYIASWDDYLYAIWPNGTLRWQHLIGSGAAVNPSIAGDGTIYIGYTDFYAINPNGTLKWTFDLGEQRHIQGSSPAISANGIIYIGVEIGENVGGEILAINPDGTEYWRKRIADEWVHSDPSIAEDGTLYIGSGDTIASGYLHAFGTVESNSPPEKPIISGASNGKVGEEYFFTFNSIDPDRNPISFCIDWGDGSGGWTKEYASGEYVEFEHLWSKKGSYIIRAKAKDSFNEESDWTEFEIKITNPRNRLSSISLFLRFLERFPFLEKLLHIQPHNSF